MRDLVLAILASLVLSASVFAQQIYVPPQVVRPNFSPGYCTWVTVDSACRFTNNPRCSNMTDVRMRQQAPVWHCKTANDCHKGAPHYGTLYDARRELVQRGVSVSYSPYKSYNWDFLQQSVQRGGTGALISLHPEQRGQAGHTVWVTGYGREGVTVQDTNHPGQPRILSFSYMQRYWNGEALSIHRSR